MGAMHWPLVPPHSQKWSPDENVKIENPHLWTGDFQQDIHDMISEATQLEIRYAHDTMPRGVLGLNAHMFNDYMKFIANRRCAQIGLRALYPGTENPFPWMSEAVDLREEVNFFEGTVTDYRKAELTFD